LKPARICVLGLFGQGNLGNECTLQALLYHARRSFPSGELLCICTDPLDTSTRHGVRAIAISRRYLRDAETKAWPSSGGRLVRWLRRAFIQIPRELLDWVQALRALLGKDMLIVSGSFLTDFSSSLLDWPYDIFKWSLIAKLCGCKLLFVSVGAGPIYRPVSRWFTRSALSLADFRSYREISTRDYLEDIGFRRHGDRISPDLAFNLPPALISHSALEGGRRRVVGIGVMNDPGKLRAANASPEIHRRYLRTLEMFSRWLLAQGYDVRLIIGDFEYDTAVARRFGAALKPGLPDGDASRVVDEPATSVEELMSQLAATDMVVATRFHNVLLALALNKPVISISFHHKSVSLMRAMELSDYSLDMSDLEVGQLIERFGALERNAEGLKGSIGRKTDEFRRQLDQQYRVIFGDSAGDARSSPVSTRTVPPRPAGDA
jgi:polysaccharide pyruvyl transferase WcaK-like protein